MEVVATVLVPFMNNMNYMQGLELQTQALVAVVVTQLVAMVVRVLLLCATPSN
jgi:hypothetical protein